MGQLTVATFNVFWFGTAESERIVRAPEDEALLGRVLDALDAQVVVFQEIVSLERLEALLATRRRPLRLRDARGHWVTSAHERDRDFRRELKVVIAWDPTSLDLVRFGNVRARPRPRGTRRPVAAHFRHRATGWEWTAVGVHFKSGPPLEQPGSREALARAAECDNLTAWVAGEGTVPGPFARPPTRDVLLTGDFNAPWDHFSLRTLSEGPMTDWRCHAPSVPATEGEAWTSWLDRTVIDHMVTSPSLTPRLLTRPEVHAFDLDPHLDPAVDGPGWLRRQTGFEARRRPGGTREPVENLWRVSDHRPVRARLAPPDPLNASRGPRQTPSP